jgi:hypothetical protein
LTINGTNFLSESTVSYNGTGHTATFVNPGQLTIQLSTGDQAKAGTYPVTVSNPAPGGGASNPASFTVDNPAPSITSLSPSSATAGAAAQTLTINGTNFVPNSTVTYNGAGHNATFVNSGQLTIQLSGSDQATAGTYPVVVTDPAPGAGVSNSVNFTVNATSTVSVSITSPSTDSATVVVGGSLDIRASVSGASNDALNWTVSGSNGGTIDQGASPHDSVTYYAPAAIPGGNNPVTITATSLADDTKSASLTVTINASASAPNAIRVTSADATGINFNLPSSSSLTLALADVGTCAVDQSRTTCEASVTGIQVSRSGAMTASCSSSVCTVWLLGQGLTDAAGDTNASNLTVSVSHGSAADVAVSGVTPFAFCAATGKAAPCGLTAITFQIQAAGAALGNRDIVVSVGSGLAKETQAYVGALQIVD